VCINYALLQLSIIIVNYNVKYFAEQCLYTVLKACKNIEAEVIFIDNNSTDGSKDFFDNKFPNVYFIWNEKNVGFSAANNLALDKATGKYILFLNPDTIVPEDCFEKCLAFFATKKNAGALGVRMIDGTGRFLKESKRGFPGLATSFFKLTGLAAIFPNSKTVARYYLGNLPEHKNHVVEVLAGAFMMVEKKNLEITGAFDENFFMYGEDIDLSFRIQKAGYKNYYFSETTIIHFKGESTTKGSFHYIKMFYGAMHLFVKKHYSKVPALLYNVFITVAMFLKGAVNFFQKIFSPTKKGEAKTAKASLTLIVASEQDYQVVIKLLNKTSTKLQVFGRVAALNDSSADSLWVLQELPKLINQYTIGNIIFCINELSAREAINALQNIRQPISFMFHTSGSCSIVGSNDKNTGGDCIAIHT
jgi:GT2 family glycosyltransferase